MIVLGIDPGSRYVGLAVRDTDVNRSSPDALLAWETLDRGSAAPMALDLWLTTILSRACTLEGAHDVERIGVEGVGAPSPHLGMTNPAAIIDSAIIVGAVIGRFGVSTVIVPAASHGDPVPDGAHPKLGRQILEASYPPDLIGPRETTGKGKSPRQHARAAYDVAGAAPRHAPRRAP